MSQKIHVKSYDEAIEATKLIEASDGSLTWDDISFPTDPEIRDQINRSAINCYVSLDIELPIISKKELKRLERLKKEKEKSNRSLKQRFILRGGIYPVVLGIAAFNFLTECIHSNDETALALSILISIPLSAFNITQLHKVTDSFDKNSYDQLKALKQKQDDTKETIKINMRLSGHLTL